MLERTATPRSVEKKVKDLRRNSPRNGRPVGWVDGRIAASRITGLANRVHGHSSPEHRTATYRSWETMRARCRNKHDPSYQLYGGRGIKVCKRWDSFIMFLKDMGERPLNTTIDRKNCNGNYKPSNCRWSTPSAQQRNKRNNRLIQFRGEIMPLVALSELSGVPYHRLWERIVRRGWSVELAISKKSQAYA